jgi:hypothetical protein
VSAVYRYAVAEAVQLERHGPNCLPGKWDVWVTRSVYVGPVKWSDVHDGLWPVPVDGASVEHDSVAFPAVIDDFGNLVEVRQ